MCDDGVNLEHQNVDLFGKHTTSYRIPMWMQKHSPSMLPTPPPNQVCMKCDATSQLNGRATVTRAVLTSPVKISAEVCGGPPQVTRLINCEWNFSIEE